jgi:hypothetical protein
MQNSHAKIDADLYILLREVRPWTWWAGKARLAEHKPIV